MNIPPKIEGVDYKIETVEIAKLRSQDKTLDEEEQYGCLIDILCLYTPLEKEFIIDNLDAEDMEKIITEITEKLTGPTVDEKKEDEKGEGEKEEFPLDGGSSGKVSPRL